MADIISKNIHIEDDDTILLFYKVIDTLFQLFQDLLNDTNIGMNNLLNISRYFQLLKKAIFHWVLSRQYSLFYYNSSDYRDEISLIIK
jgi:hypothetical protein